MTITYYTPEMGDKKPDSYQIESSLSHSGTHYFIETPFNLNGRGIIHLSTNKPDELTRSGQYKAGWKRYQVTKRAHEELAEEYNIISALHLD